MAEKAEPAETLKPRLMRRIKNARGWFWSVFPWPEQFYEREEDLEPIASDLMVSLTSIIIFIQLYSPWSRSIVNIISTKMPLAFKFICLFTLPNKIKIQTM